MISDKVVLLSVAGMLAGYFLCWFADYINRHISAKRSRVALAVMVMIGSLISLSGLLCAIIIMMKYVSMLLAVIKPVTL